MLPHVGSGTPKHVEWGHGHIQSPLRGQQGAQPAPGAAVALGDSLCAYISVYIHVHTHTDTTKQLL